MMEVVPELSLLLNGFSIEAIQQAEIQIKYQTYIDKEKELVGKMGQLESLVIPDAFDYGRVSALSNEARQKFLKIRPRTLGQASRISGVNPSDVQILMVFMGR
jgi:tRNA uridine 5-carboxymethylaminomethyl modification enzyme